MNIAQYSPQSGRFLKEDGTYVNIADVLGGTETGQTADIEKYTPHTGRFIKEDGTVINIAENIGSGGGGSGGGSSDDSAPPIVEEYNGQVIQSFISADRPLKGLNLYATTEQATTTGAQLWDVEKAKKLDDELLKNIMLVEGSSVLPYEPYTGGIPSPNGDYPQEIQVISDFVVEVKNSMGEVATPQTLNVTIPEQGFYGIPVTEGGNYTDSSGQQWICDEFNFANKKFIKRTGRMEFDGSLDEKWVLNSTTAARVRFYIAILGASTKNGQECWCNRAKFGTDGTAGKCFTTSGRFYIDVDTSIKSVESLKQYLSTHELDVIYELETPVEYDLTDEQVEQFKKLKSYYGTTYIDNDAVPACNMTAEIIADTKLYIDDKIGQIATQMLENSNKINDIVNMLGMVDSWKVVQQLIKKGYGADVFPIGTQLRCSHSVYGEIIWDVVAHDYNLEESEHSMTLLSHDCVVNAIQYDAAEALYYAETELAAGTYYFSLLSGYDTNYGGGKNIQFTLTKPVPAGGVIMFPWRYNTQSTATKISTYSSRESTAALETVTVTEGTSGTNLGTTDGKTANMNYIDRVRYGSNNWKESAVRQFLNSNAEAGSVWTPQTKFARPPLWASSTDGFMKGFDDDFLSVVGECNHLTKTNSVFEVDGNLNKLYTTKDHFYLASHSEIFGGSENNLADGTQFPYYNEATNTDRIKYNAETAQHWWLRSPLPSYAYVARSVNTDGSLSNLTASSSYGVAVACDIY